MSFNRYGRFSKSIRPDECCELILQQVVRSSSQWNLQYAEFAKWGSWCLSSPQQIERRKPQRLAGWLPLNLKVTRLYLINMEFFWTPLIDSPCSIRQAGPVPTDQDKEREVYFVDSDSDVETLGLALGATSIS